MKNIDIFSELTPAEKMVGEIKGKIAALLENKRDETNAHDSSIYKLIRDLGLNLTPYKYQQIENCEVDLRLSDIVDILNALNVELDFSFEIKNNS